MGKDKMWMDFPKKFTLSNYLKSIVNQYDLKSGIAVQCNFFLHLHLHSGVHQKFPKITPAQYTVK
jgi:hypothetical protein